jgi:hypothetical protein
MKCFSLLLGARHTGTDGTRFRASDDRRIREITRSHFPGGFTILAAQGGWYDPEARRFVEEESRQILVCAPSRRLAAWCRDLAHALKQEELLVVELGRARKFRVGGGQRAGRG